MFVEFRQIVKKYLNDNKLNYRQLASMAHLSESTIKCFMSGANDSRRVAEKISDALNLKMIYSNNTFTVLF